MRVERTWREVEVELSSQRVLLDQYTKQFDRYTADSARLALSQTAGSTAGHWNTAGAQLAAARSLLDKWRGALDEVAQAGAQQRRRRDLDRAVSLLWNAVLELDSTELPKLERRSPGSVSDRRRYTLVQARQHAKSHLEAVRQLIKQVTDVRQAAQENRALLRRIEEAAREDAAPVIDALRAEVEEMDERARRDPLTLDLPTLRELRFRLEQFKAAQPSVTVRREAVADRLDRIGLAIDRLEAEESDARARLAALADLVPYIGSLPTPRAAPGLRRRLAVLNQRLGTAWQRVGEECSALEAAVDSASRNAAEVSRISTRCVRADCPGGELDAEGVCEACFRAPARPSGSRPQRSTP